MDIDALLAQRVQSLRKARALTLDQLAEASGVSRSMISLIERRETSPTAAVLSKLAGALQVTLSELLSEAAREDAPLPLLRQAEQPVWTDPASGYVRRQLSPGGVPSPIELVEVCFPPRASVCFEHMDRHVATHQQVWMLDGEMEITIDQTAWRLRAGDCLAIVLGPSLVFRNPTRRPARYLVALAAAPAMAVRTARRP